MLIVNQRHLQAAIDEYCLHYNGERPHRSRSLRPPASPGDRVQTTDGQIERTTRLGGLLSDYRRVPQVARRDFQTQHQASAIVLTDFLSVDTVLLKRLYVLLYGAGEEAGDLVRGDRPPRR
jgi:hypothetical protein